MAKPFFVLSPCGTSVLTNATDPDLRNVINRHSNAKTEDEVRQASIEEHRRIADHLTAARQRMTAADHADAQKISAELNGILSLYDGNCGGRKSDFHQLLCTDTWLGEESAKCVQEWLKGNGLVAELRRQPDLRTKELAAFHSALSDLVEWCEKEIDPWRQSRHVVFNLTGGFKSIQGFLQTLAQFYADETVYIFETGPELLRLPRLPLRMAADETVKEHLSIFRRLSLGLNVPPEDTNCIPETLRMNLDGQACLSPWGDLVWAQTKKTIYAEKVHAVEGLTSLLAFGNDFDRSVADLEKTRVAMVNERIDDLVRHLEKRSQDGKGHNPPSLDFKQLRGNPSSPSTHECDAWSDQDAKRLFGHFDTEGRFLLDRLDKALH